MENNKNTEQNTQDKEKVVRERIERALEQLDKKEFTIYFFVVDSKNVPNASMQYIYQMAKTFQDKEYKVCMLYQLGDAYSPGELAEIEAKGGVPDDMKRFVGVREWLGDEFADLPHMNIMKEEWTVGPSDFVFIPEVFSSFMFQTWKNKLPGKRYIILQNPGYVTEFIPFDTQWINYGIDHVVTTCQAHADWINDLFPYTKEHTTILSPYIPGYFRKPITPKKLIVNIVSKNPDDINKVLKPFYWKNPIYRFVYFDDLRGLNKKEFAERLKQGMVTLWLDESTPFGYSALEAMRCGNLVVGRIPTDIPEWMTNENGIWFNNLNDVPEILSKVVGTLLADEIPQHFIDAMEETNKKYTFEEYNTNFDKFAKQMVEERKAEIVAFQESVMSENKNNEPENE